jgi:hypothetical protein
MPRTINTGNAIGAALRWIFPADETTIPPKAVNEAACSLGSLGGNKRKETTTPEQRRTWEKLSGRPRKLLINDILKI